MNRQRPDFVIIGAQKAASTFLHRGLRAHPAIWLPADEDHYFHDPNYRREGFDAFAARYERRTEPRVGMKCPDYLGRPEVPSRLFRDLAAPDLMVCLRDPVQRALSGYFWWMRWGMVPVEPPEQGLRRLLDGGFGDRNAVVSPILDYGLYHQHLSRYLEHFPREKLFVLLDEDLRRDASAALRRAHEFLGVDPDIAAVSLPETKGNPGVYSPQRLKFLNLRNRYMLRWDESGTFGSLSKPHNPATRLYCNAVAATDRYVLARLYGNAKPSLSDELTARLRDHYRDDLTRLEVLIGRDLSAWKASCASR